MSHCLECKRKTKNADLKVLKTKTGRTMLSSKCGVCGSKKSSSSLGIKSPLSNIPLLGNTFS